MVNKKEMPEPKNAATIADLHPNEEFKVAELTGRKYKARTERLLETLENVRQSGATAATEDEPELYYNKFCLFKLSDLGLFKAFPLIFIKRGLTI